MREKKTEDQFGKEYSVKEIRGNTRGLMETGEPKCSTMEGTHEAMYEVKLSKRIYRTVVDRVRGKGRGEKWEGLTK